MAAVVEISYEMPLHEIIKGDLLVAQESKPDTPPAADPTDRRQPQVSDAVGAAFPMKEALRADSK